MCLKMSKKLDFSQTEIDGLYLAERVINRDPRGEFYRVYCEEEFRDVGYSAMVLQSNISKTIGEHTIRGLHYQKPPFLESKIVTCISGEVFDVAVDLRKNSATKFRYFSVILSDVNKKSILIPAGFAHGFQVLSNEALMLYMHSGVYNESCETGVSFKDPKIGIEWPYEGRNLSHRDSSFEYLASDFEGVNIC